MTIEELLLEQRLLDAERWLRSGGSHRAEARAAVEAASGPRAAIASAFARVSVWLDPRAGERVLGTGVRREAS